MKARQRQPGSRSLRATQRGTRGVLLAAFLVAGGCDEPPPPRVGAALLQSAPARDPALVAFVGAGEGDPLWPILKTGAQRYGDRLGAIRIRFLIPTGRSAQDQIECLRSLGDLELRGLCIHIIDADALKPILRKMYNRGIRIVSIIHPAPREIRAGHVGFNERRIGAALAETTISALDGAGSIVLLHAGYEHPIYGPRRIAFENTLKPHRQIEVFARKDCRTNPREARRIIRDYSQRFPRLSAWVALDDWPLRDRGLDDLAVPPGCKFITFGGTPMQWPLIETGVSPGVAAVNYGELGAKAVQYRFSARAVATRRSMSALLKTRRCS